MDFSHLERIGLTEGEVKVFVALLKSESQSKSQLAANAKVSSSKVYDITSRLMDKGLVNSMKIDGVMRFSASDPSSLLRYVDMKESELKKEREIVENLIPKVTALQSRVQPDIGFELFNGWDGFQTASLEALDSAAPKSSISAIGGQRHAVPESFVSKYHRIRNKKKMSIRVIFPGRISKDVSRKDLQMRMIPGLSSASFSIFPDRVLITSLEDEPTTLVIRHPHMRKSFLQMFESLWASAKPAS